MADVKNRIIPMPIEEEVKTSYLNYAMSVIVSRALPDVRDGLKPVHRRILFAMNEMGLHADKPYKKCATDRRRRARQVPPPRRHGDLRLARAPGAGLLAALPRGGRAGQLRQHRRRPPRGGPLHRGAAGQASPRRCCGTSTRRPSTSAPTTTARRTSPWCCPAAFPFLLANGSSGIAVGMATNIPPHNLRRDRGSRRDGLIDRPGPRRRGADEDRARPRLPHGRHHPRAGRASATPTPRAGAR